MVSYIDKRYCPQNNKPDKCYKSRCKKVFYRHMNVSLPVEITPMACINYFGIKYCGKPKVICLKKKKGTKYELRLM